MTGTFEAANAAAAGNYDFDLGVEGFRYSDLFSAEKLQELAEKFYAELAEENPLLAEALNAYIAARGEDYEQKVESKILTDAAPYLSEFVARLSASSANAKVFCAKSTSRTRSGNTNSSCSAARPKSSRPRKSRN